MKTILVIEDTPDIRENIAEILQLAPYEVVQAANGKEGIVRARQTRPDLILCDIMMPELDGFGVLHILGKDPVLADVPFIFLTAKAELADFRAGMDLGADDYLTKPFDDLTLLNAVELRLRKSKRAQPAGAGLLPNPVGFEQLIQALLNEENVHQPLCQYYAATRHSRKHQLFMAGDWPTEIYFIKKGRLKLFKSDSNGNEYITTLLGPGEFAGYLALLEETAYAETAEVLEEAEVCAIPKADFLVLIHQNQQVAAKFIRTLAGNVGEQQDQLLTLAYQSVRKRVAEALLQLQRKFYADPAAASPPAEGAGSLPAANTSLPMNLSRENLAHLVGASTETVIRVLSDLRAAGLISLSDRQITLLDLDKLVRLKH